MRSVLGSRDKTDWCFVGVSGAAVAVCRGLPGGFLSGLSRLSEGLDGPWAAEMRFEASREPIRGNWTGFGPFFCVWWAQIRDVGEQGPGQACRDLVAVLRCGFGGLRVVLGSNGGRLHPGVACVRNE